MAGNLLMSVSQDERERAIFLSRQKLQTDLASNLATAEDRGRREGRAEVAQKLLLGNRPIGEIMEDIGLAYDEVKSLYDSY